MALIIQASWLEAAKRDAPSYRLTPTELLIVWARHPDWAPGGRYYLPSSHPEAMLRVDCQEDYMLEVDWLNAFVWVVIPAAWFVTIIWVLFHG